MVSIQSYIVLRHLKQIADNTEIELCLLGDTTLICPTYEEDKSYDYSKYKGEIRSILDDLFSSGHISYPSANKNFFALTEKGIHPMQGLYFSFISFLFRSVLIPISVSAITTIVLFFIEHWLMH